MERLPGNAVTGGCLSTKGDTAIFMCIFSFIIMEIFITNGTLTSKVDTDIMNWRKSAEKETPKAYLIGEINDK
jgi:hypothetical protein